MKAQLMKSSTDANLERLSLKASRSAVWDRKLSTKSLPKVSTVQPVRHGIIQTRLQSSASSMTVSRCAPLPANSKTFWSHTLSIEHLMDNAGLAPKRRPTGQLDIAKFNRAAGVNTNDSLLVRKVEDARRAGRHVVHRSTCLSLTTSWADSIDGTTHQLRG